MGKKGTWLRSGRRGEPILFLLLFHHLRRFSLVSYTRRATCAGAVRGSSIIRQDQTRFWLRTRAAGVFRINRFALRRWRKFVSRLEQTSWWVDANQTFVSARGGFGYAQLNRYLGNPILSSSARNCGSERMPSQFGLAER